MKQMPDASKTEALVTEWQQYIAGIKSWHDQVSGLKPKLTGCGFIYELVNPINRPDESFAIADMRELTIAEPHYHPIATEVYIVLSGKGLVVVGGEQSEVTKGSVVVIPPCTAHFTMPGPGLVLAVINTPPFQTDDYIVLAKSKPEVGFDKKVFLRLSKRAT